MKKFASITAVAILAFAAQFTAAADNAGSDINSMRERIKELEEQVEQLKAKLVEQAKLDAEIISMARAENRALKKQLRAAKRSARLAKIEEEPEVKSTKERAEQVEKKTEERISEKESESEGFHMFPF